MGDERTLYERLTSVNVFSANLEDSSSVVCICMYVNTYICTYICIHTDTYIYIHTLYARNPRNYGNEWNDDVNSLARPGPKRMSRHSRFCARAYVHSGRSIVSLMCICMYMHVYVYICVHVSGTYIYIYT